MKVIAFKRELQGSGASRRLRISGQTPGIVYGGAEAPVLISLDHNALYHALKKEVFHSSILELEIDGDQAGLLALEGGAVHGFSPGAGSPAGGTPARSETGISWVAVRR